MRRHLSLLVCLTCLSLHADPLPFGFAPPEIFLSDFGTRALRVADLNQDGRPDLLLINQERGRLDIYLQRDPEDPVPAPPLLRMDRWQPVLQDGRFQRQSLIIGGNLYDLVTGDFNNDGHKDFAVTDNQNRLHIYHGPMRPGWQAYARVDVTAAQNAPGTLAWDPNEQAIMLLGERDLQEVRWDPDTQTYQAQTVATPPPGSRPHGILLEDLDQNGQLDVLYSLRAPRFNLAIHRRTAQGLDNVQLPPLDPPVERFTSFEQNPVSLLGLHPRSGTLQKVRFEKQDAAFSVATTTDLDVRFLNFPGPARDMVVQWPDFSGDGRLDVATLSPGRPEILWYTADDTGGFHVPERLAVPSGLNWIVAGNWFADTQPQQLLMHDTDSRYLGITPPATDQLIFPLQLENQTEILGVTPWRYEGETQDRMLAIVREDRAYFAKVWHLHQEDETLLLQEHQTIDLPFVNRDVFPPIKIQPGIFLVCSAFDSAFFLVQEPGTDTLTAVEAAEGFSKSILRRKKPDDFLILPKTAFFPTSWVLLQDSAAQFLQADANGTVRVIHQINLQGTGRLRGLLPFDEQGELLGLFDGTRNLMEIHQSSGEGNLRHIRDIPLPPMQVQDVRLHHDQGTYHLRVQGREQIALIRPVPAGLAVSVETLYETDLPETRHQMIVTGDFNGNDQQNDIALIDPLQSRVMEFLHLNEEHWQPVMHFQIYDASAGAGGRRGGNIEPREVLVADVNGDGLDDLLLLIHDRILVYIQDPVPEEAP